MEHKYKAQSGLTDAGFKLLDELPGLKEVIHHMDGYLLYRIQVIDFE